MTPEDPFENRLRAYLEGRAGVPVPPDLLASAEAVGRSRSMHSWPRPRLALGLGAVAIGVLIVASTLRYLPFPAATLPSSVPGTSQTAVSPLESPVSSPTATGPGLEANGFPSNVLGLPVISVAEARRLIDGGQHQGRAMAVGGWWSEAVMAMGCPAPMDFRSVIEGYCSLTALAPTDGQIDHYQHSGNASSESFQAPDDALLPREVPEMAGYNEPWHGVTNDVVARQLPQRVVLIGHVGDPRAWQCAGDAFRSCQKEFVVDAFAWVEGRSIDAWNDRGGPRPHLTVAEARAATKAALPDGKLVTISSWDDSYIPELDPRIGPDAGGFWLARLVAGSVDAQGTSRLVEVLVDDQSREVHAFEMSFAAGTEPGSVHFDVSGSFFNGNGQLPALYAAILDTAGKRLQETWIQSMGNAPAVLPEGDYAVVSWSGDPNVSVANPTQPPRRACSGSVHVAANTIVAVRITWNSDMTCEIRDGATTQH